MIDLEKRLRRTFSSMAAYESLEDVLDDDAATAMLNWGQVVAKQFVLKTSQMECRFRVAGQDGAGGAAENR